MCRLSSGSLPRKVYMCDIVDSNSVFLVFFVMSLVIIGLELVRVFLFWRASRNKQEEGEGEGEGEVEVGEA